MPHFYRIAFARGEIAAASMARRMLRPINTRWLVILLPYSEPAQAFDDRDAETVTRDTVANALDIKIRCC
jgi:hypothetical protein